MVASDSVLVREGLAAVLAAAPDVGLVDTCAEAGELERLVATTHPNVVVTGTHLPPGGDGEGIRVAGRLRETDPDVGVVALSEHMHPADAVELMGSDSRGRAYLLTEHLEHPSSLTHAMATVADGGSTIDPLVVDALIAERTHQHTPFEELTTRELEVLAEIADGKSNAAIASSLVLTKRAVEKHVHSIFAKLGLADAANVSRRVKATLLFLDEREWDEAHRVQ